MYTYDDHLMFFFVIHRCQSPGGAAAHASSFPPWCGSHRGQDGQRWDAWLKHARGLTMKKGGLAIGK